MRAAASSSETVSEASSGDELLFTFLGILVGRLPMAQVGPFQGVSWSRCSLHRCFFSSSVSFRWVSHGPLCVLLSVLETGH